MDENDGLLVIPPPRRLTCDERVGDDATVGDFWRWAFSDVRDNVTRGVLAEWLVGLALRCVDGVRPAWADHDLLSDGIKIEVKSAAYLQSWPSPRNPPISFRGLSAYTWDPLTGKSSTTRTYNADVYVFALLTAREHAHFDPLDVHQWEFWVADLAAVRNTGCRSLGLERVRRLSEGPLRFTGLPDAVRDASVRAQGSG